MTEDEHIKPSRMALLLPLGSVAILAWMLVTFVQIGRDLLSHVSLEWFAVLLSPFVLLAGALLLRWRPRLGYIVAFGAVLPLPWISISESRSYGNSWTALNTIWKDPYGSHYQRYFELRIITVALLLMTLIAGLTRLLPARWKIQNRPVNEQTWPAIAISLIFMGFWFAAYVSPYREPMIVGGMPPEFGILNVRKDGMTFHECRVSIYRDGRYYVARNDRQLFRYSFRETIHEGLLTEDLRAKLRAVQSLPELKRTQDKSPRALRARHGEGWYTEMGTYAITAFTTENATTPPADLVAFFHTMEESLSTSESSHYELRDVCLGFCYDPKAGLGYRAENQRCAYGANGKEFCY